jgi:hypothetical protein
MQTNVSLYVRVAFMHGKREGHTLKLLVWASSVSLKGVDGAPHASEMFVLTKYYQWLYSYPSKEFLFYYEKYTPPADANHSGYVPCP